MSSERVTRVLSAAVAGAILAVANMLPAQAAYPGENGRIAFVRSDNGTDIFTVKPSGEDQRELVTSGRSRSNPEWAPSGRRLLYIRGGGTYDTDLMVVRRNGNGNRRVVDVRGGIQDASWSPHGSHIVFSVTTGADAGDIYIVRSNGKDLRPVSTGRAGEYSVAWSPNGNRIAFVSDEGGGDIWTMNTRGEKRRRVTEEVTVCRKGCGDRFGSVSGLDWAPGGNRLTFSVNKGDGASYVYTIRPDGTKEDRVTEGKNPSWSPNGKRIAYAVQAPSLYAIFTIRVDGTKRFRVTQPPRMVDDARPDWGPRPTAR